MIYTDGCLPKASNWFERHILPVAIIIAILAVLQVNKSRLIVDNIFFLIFKILGICFAQNLRNDILAQKAKWTWHAHTMLNYYRHK
jgi:tetraspanin-5